MTKQRSLAYLLLLLNAILWGAALPIAKTSFAYINPTEFLYFRYLIAAPLVLPFLLYLLHKNKKLKKHLPLIILLELTSPISLILLYKGLALTSAIEASLISAASPLFTTIGGIIFLKEKEERREWLGLLISFAGTLFLVLEPLINGQHSLSAISLKGNLLILTYNLIWTVYVLLAKKHYRKVPKTLIPAISIILSLFVMFFYTLFTQPLPSLSLLTIPAVAFAVLYMGIIGSIIGLFLYIAGLNLIEASEASLFTYLNGIIAIPFAVVLLKEIPTKIEILAIILILFGVILAELRFKKNRR